MHLSTCQWGMKRADSTEHTECQARISPKLCRCDVDLMGVSSTAGVISITVPSSDSMTVFKDCTVPSGLSMAHFHSTLTTDMFAFLIPAFLSDCMMDGELVSDVDCVLTISSKSAGTSCSRSWRTDSPNSCDSCICWLAAGSTSLMVTVCVLGSG